MVVLLCSCASSPDDRALSHSRVLSSSHAIAAVRHDITSQGGDPEASEYRAGRRGPLWFVTAWHVRHPQAKGPARFDPGGFTTYIVNSQGHVVEKLPGR